jgi:hypothetical protein
VVDPNLRITSTLLTGAGVVRVGGRDLVVAGNAITYRVQVSNLSTVALQNLTLDNATFTHVADADGNLTIASLGAAPAAIATLPGLGSFTTTFTVTVPADALGKTLVNRSSLAPGGVGPLVTEHPVIALDPAAGLVITEMVLSPQRDWNDSDGGNARPFDATPGTGAVDAADRWVEIIRPVGATNDWSVVLIDDTGEEASRELSTGTGSGQVRVLSGFDPLPGAIVTVEVRDGSGAVQQSIDVAAIDGVLGPATGAANESLTWSTAGFASPVLQQFVRRAASIGVLTP